MKYLDWDTQKNEKLKTSRGISFEEIIIAIVEGRLIKTLRHPNKKKYPNQKMYIVNVNNYAYLVPFVEDEDKVFLKTAIPSRVATKKYLIERSPK